MMATCLHTARSIGVEAQAVATLIARGFEIDQLMYRAELMLHRPEGVTSIRKEPIASTRSRQISVE